MLSLILNCWLCGCLHDTGATFAPERVHSGSLSWLYFCLHDTTTKYHAGASHPGVSSPRPVRNLATVSCNSWRKRETTTRFGARSVCRLEAWKGSACLVFAILNHTCVLPTWSVPSNNQILKPVTLLYVSWFSPENGSRFEGSEYCLFQIFVVKMTHLTSFSWWRLTKKKLRKVGHQKILHISLGDL